MYFKNRYNDGATAEDINRYIRDRNYVRKKMNTQERRIREKEKDEKERKLKNKLYKKKKKDELNELKTILLTTNVDKNKDYDEIKEILDGLSDSDDPPFTKLMKKKKKKKKKEEEIIKKKKIEEVLEKDIDNESNDDDNDDNNNTNKNTSYLNRKKNDRLKMEFFDYLTIELKDVEETIKKDVYLSSLLLVVCHFI